LSLLQANVAAGDQASAVLRASRRREDLPENMLERQICDFLSWRGFITIRQQVGLFLPFRVVKQLKQGQITFDQALRNVVSIGEQGAADWWSARPIIPAGSRPLDGPHPWQAFFWECKAPGKKPTDAQLAWINKRRLVGLEATWFNQFTEDLRTVSKLGRDWPTPACEPRESHMFQVWFSQYFTVK
jgi:hypothetical protein